MRWLLLLIAGCAVIEPVPVETRADIQEKLRLTNAPLPLCVGVLCSHNSNSPTLDAKRVAKSLELLFASVKQLPSSSKKIPPSTLRRFHFIVRLKTGNVKARYLGRTGWRVPKIMVWSISEFLSALIADERYEVTGEISVEVSSPYKGGAPLFRKEQELKTEVVVNDWQRGFKFWGIWFVPKWLKPHNLRRVAEKALPRLEEEAKAAVVRSLAEFLLKEKLTSKERIYAWLGIVREKPPAKQPPVRLLALGLVEYKWKYSAERFIDAASRVLGNPDLRRIVTLSTRKEVEKLFKHLKNRGVKRALVYIGFEGDGQGRFHLPDGVLKLGEIFTRLKESGVQDCFVVLDGPLAEEHVPGLGGWLLVAACGPGEKSHFSGRGTHFSELMSRYLLRWRPKRLSAVHLREVFRVWMSRQLRIRRVKQTPKVWGEGFGGKAR